MSSHILAEVDRLATRIGIIHQGRLIEEMSAAQLEARRGVRLVVEARDPDAARRGAPGRCGRGHGRERLRPRARPLGGVVTAFVAALRVEALKTRRSVVPLVTAPAVSIAPLVGGLFMHILADPERARHGPHPPEGADRRRRSTASR